MSWNPGTFIPGANWNPAGSGSFATKNQLTSTTAGIYQDLADFNFSTIQVSTLNVPEWISTPVLYVSDIVGAQINISGITINSNGILNAPVVSLSTMNLTGVNLGGVKVGFDLGLGQAVGGLLGGLGALVGGGLIAAGTGVGLAVSGTAQGIGTAIAGRPANYINSNVYETINFTSQLQVSTLGNAFPAYSSIFRTVSSVSANTVPGAEIFTSTIFYPGQICIRSASDPINLITGDSNLNTSTIQSFGQWVPLVGLEPEDIFANSISTNYLSAGIAYVDSIAGIYGGYQNFTAGTLIVPDSIPTYGSASLNMGYESPAKFTLGSLGSAQLLGGVNYFWQQSDQDIVFSKVGNPSSTPISARLELGGANESILTISTINASGPISAPFATFSSLVTNSLLVISTFSTSYTQSNVTTISTSIIEANAVYATTGYFSSLGISTITPFQIQGPLGNPNGPYDITKVDTVVSTTYNQISSLTQNILQYSLNIGVQNEANFNIYNGQSQLALYSVTPANIGQWASTMLQFGTFRVPGQIDLGSRQQWGVSPGDLGAVLGGATFDVTYTNFDGAYANSFLITEEDINGTVSTFYNYPGPAGFTGFSTFRLTLPPAVGGSRSGWWQIASPAGAPYATSNNNTFSISQDINDTYITGTDRLHIQAGDIFLDGNTTYSNLTATTLNVSTVNADVLNTTNLTTNGGVFQTISTQSLATSNLISETYSNVFSYTGSYNTPGPTTPLSFQYLLNSTDYTGIRTLNVPSRGPNMFNSLNVGEWNNTVYNNPVGVTPTAGAPIIYLGELLKTSGYAYSGRFWINNTISPALSMPVYVIKSGSWLSTLGYATNAGTGFTLIQTTNGTNWSLTSNVPSPQLLGGYSYSNQYQLQMNQQLTQLNVNTPLTEFIQGTKTVVANKVLMAANQIRTLTYNIPSYPPREAGFELTSYFDANVVFSGSQSDAINPIISPAGNLGYAVQAWSPQIWFGRIRTQSLGIQGFEVEAVVTALSGTTGDIIWSSHRYLNVVDTTGLSADLREIYFMVPCNYMTYETLVGPY